MKKLFILILSVTMILSIAACGAPAAQVAEDGVIMPTLEPTPEPTQSPTPSPTEEPTPKPILPLTVSAYNNTYVVKEVSVGKDEKGNTTVIATGSGFDVIPMRNGAWVIPVECSIISGGSEYSTVSAGTNPPKVTYQFDTSAEPDSIVLYPGDNPNNRTVIEFGVELTTEPKATLLKENTDKLSFEEFIRRFNAYLQHSCSIYPENNILSNVKELNKNHFQELGEVPDNNHAFAFYLDDIYLLLILDDDNKVVDTMVDGRGFNGEDEIFNATQGIELAVMKSLLQTETPSEIIELCQKIIDTPQGIQKRYERGDYTIFINFEWEDRRSLSVTYEGSN